MKKRMLALLTGALVASTLLGSLGLSAEEPAGIDDQLVVHYDFEGDTPEQQLADKATAGTSKETLILASTQDENGENLTYIQDGKAHVDMAEGNYLLSDFSADTSMGADLQGLNDLTVFIQFSANGSGSQWADIFHVDNLVRCFVPTTTNGAFDLRVRLGEACNSSGRLDTNALGQSFFCEDGSGEGDIVCLAIAVTTDAAAKTVGVSVYTSYDNGENYELLEKSWNDIEAFYSTGCGRITLGKLFDVRDTNNRGYSFDLYDFRIYNSALNEAQIQSITGVEPDEEGDETSGTTGEDETDAPPTDNTDGNDTDEPTRDEQTTDTPANSESGTDTQAPAAGGDGGCGSVLGLSGILAVVAAASLAGVVVNRKRRN